MQNWPEIRISGLVLDRIPDIWTNIRSELGHKKVQVFSNSSVVSRKHYVQQCVSSTFAVQPLTRHRHRKFVIIEKNVNHNLSRS